MSWFNPKPPDPPIIRPTPFPKVVVPSFIGEEGQVLNLLMHHGSGGFVRDYSGFGNHGTLMPTYPTNAPTWVDGQFGWALNFDDVTNHIVIPDSPSLDITDAIMLISWVYLPDVVDFRSLIIKADGTHEPYRMSLSSTRIQLQLSQNAATRATAQTGIDALIVGWQQVAATYDRTTVRFYRNTVEYPNVGDAPVFPMRVTAQDLFIGIRQDVFSPFNGIILFPRIYNIVDASLITRHFESTRAIFGV